MTLNEWKNTEVRGNEEIRVALFRQIVKSAKSIRNKTFGFKVSKKALLDNIKTSACRIIAFNGFRAMVYGDSCCYRLEKSIGITGDLESLTLIINL